MQHVYLDQNKWIDLSKADYGTRSGKPFEDVLAATRTAVIENRARFPLSLAHYMETWNQRNANRRKRLASTMLTIAMAPEYVGPCTIAGPQEIIAMELEACIRQRLGVEIVPQKVFGDGLGHVFGDPTYARTTVPLPEGYPDQLLPMARSLKRFGDQALEKMVLSGPPIDFPIPGIDNQTYYDLSQTYLQRQVSIRERFDDLGVSKETRREALAGVVIQDILEIIARVLKKMDVSHEVLQLHGARGVLDLVSELPSQRLLLEMMSLSYDNPQFKRDRGDMNDLSMLSVAAVYCDVVVAERTWGEIIKRTRIDQEHGTIVLSDLRDLVPLLKSQRPSST